MEKGPAIACVSAGCIFVVLIVGILSGAAYFLYSVQEDEALRQEEQEQIEAERLLHKKEEARAAEEQAKDDQARAADDQAEPETEPVEKAQDPGATLITKKSPAEEAARKSSPDFQQAVQLVKKHQFKEALELYNRAFYTVQRFKDGFIGTTPVSEWLEPKKQAFFVSVANLGDELLNQFKAEKAPVDVAVAYVRAFGRVDDVQPQMKQLNPWIEHYYRGFGRNKVLVDIQADDFFQERIATEIENHFPDKSRFGLAFRHRIPYRFSASKVLRVRTRATDAEYREKSGRRLSIPKSITLQFDLTGDREYSTSWDKLSSIGAAVEPPAQLPGDYDREKLEQTYAGKLADELAAKFADFPAFELFPKANPADTTLLDAHGRIDQRAARILAARDRTRLKTAIDELVDKDLNDTTKAQLCAVIIEADLQAHTDWVVTNAPTVEGYHVNTIINALSDNPDFGNFDPLIALLSHSRGRGAFRILVEHAPFHSKVATAVKAALNDKDTPNRAVYVNDFIRSLDETEKANYIHWIRARDPQFAVQAAKSLIASDLAMLERLLLEEYDAVLPEVKIALWHAIGRYRYFARDGYSPKILALSQKEARADNSDVAAAALSPIRSSLRRTLIWKNAVELARDLPKGETRDKFLEDIVENAAAQERDDALPFLKELFAERTTFQRRLLKEDDKRYRATMRGTLREECLETIFRVNPHFNANFAMILQSLKEDPSDTKLLYNAADLIQDYRRNDKLDFTNASVQDLIKAGLKSEHAITRRCIYIALTDAARRGVTQYKDDLQEAQESENDLFNKRILKRAIEAKPKR